MTWVRHSASTGRHKVARTFLSATGCIGLLLIVAACTSAPKYPQPHGSDGQILVKLNGEPKQGVQDESHGHDDYKMKRQSLKQRKAFEHVDYDDLKDVVVMLEGGEDTHGTGKVEVAGLSIDGSEFNHEQAMTLMRDDSGGPGAGATMNAVVGAIEVTNTSGKALHISGFSDTGAALDFSVPAGKKLKVAVRKAGKYDLYCDEAESAHAVLYAIDADGAWIGDSEDSAFFDHLPPGDYTVTVYPPRLPEWSKKVSVRAGRRTVVTAELTVNNLPKAD